MKVQRAPISKTTRFEVFKRDSFTCQYCGNKAPDVILEVDHVNPVAKGGENELLNLVTSCFNCNRGKRDRLLSDTSVVSIQRKQVEELQERRNQIEMMLQWKQEFDPVVAELEGIQSHIATLTNDEISLSDSGIANFKGYLREYGFAKVLDAVSVCHERYFDENGAWLNRVVGVLKYAAATPEEQKIMLLKRILRNKFQNYRAQKAAIMLKEYFEVFNDYDECLDYAKKCTSFNQWYEGMTNFYNENKDSVMPPPFE